MKAAKYNPAAVFAAARVSRPAFVVAQHYGKSTIGARSDIERVAHRAPAGVLPSLFNQPDNATLVVAGKIDEAKTLALVRQYFAAIPRPARQLRKTYTAEPTQDGERFGDAVGVSATCRRSVSSITCRPVRTKSFPRCRCARILGDTPSGRLYKAWSIPARPPTFTPAPAV